MLAEWSIDALFRRNDVQFNVTANLLKYNELGKLFNKKRRHGHLYQEQYSERKIRATKSWQPWYPKS